MRSSIARPHARARASSRARAASSPASRSRAAGVRHARRRDRSATPTVADGDARRSRRASSPRSRGRARAMLTGERTALNLLGRLCGIATATRALVDRVAGTRARIADTRKTTPGLRALEKYAVRCGGGSNHRFGLDDAVLDQRQSPRARRLGSRSASRAVRARVGHMVKIEVEVDTLDAAARGARRADRRRAARQHDAASSSRRGRAHGRWTRRSPKRAAA